MSPRLRLFLLGFLTLFLELILIRYLGGNIWNLGFFPNLVLLGVFVGMGIGFVSHRLVPDERAPLLFEAASAVLLLLLGFVHFFRPSVPGFKSGLGVVAGEVFYTGDAWKASASGLWPFLFWFLAVVVIFALISQLTAKAFRELAPLTAYTLDIAGSCCGILAFMAVSWLQAPAWLWLVLAAIPALAARGGSAGARLRLAVAWAAIAALAWHQDTQLLRDPDYAGDLEVRWSPYQKVESTREPERPGMIYVNGVTHQGMIPGELLPQTFYQAPYTDRARRLLPPCRAVLVIGAGSGNDVAAALMNGAEHVDAVEIDPVILELGRRNHPARPYDDPRVSVTVGDGRAFMTAARRRYDLIVFALTDSLVKVSPMAQLRLENYLFTEDSARRAFGLLSDSGSLVFYNSYRFPWVRDKIGLMLAQATGRWPETLMETGNFSMLLSSPQQPPAPPLPPLGIDVATDDWPFPYLRQRGIPDLYRRAMAVVALLVLALLVLLRSIRGGETLSGLRGTLLKLAFLLMGTAFLLLETKSVIQFSLLFGTTWLNNSLVFLAVLVLVLLANWTAQSVAWPALPWLAYLLLMAFSLGALVFPLAGLLQVESAFARFLLASLLTFAPIYFANLIFSLSFRDQQLAEHLFGWNLIGATLGGALEYTSMLVGYNALAVVVAACYSLVFLLLLAERRLRV